MCIRDRYAVKAAKGEEIPAFIDTGVNVTRAEQLGVEPEADATYDIALIVKATDSGFWQKALDGGKAFGADNENVNVKMCIRDSEDVPGIKVKVKDTVGAGDAFSAGFIMEYIKKMCIRDRICMDPPCPRQ